MFAFVWRGGFQAISTSGFCEQAASDCMWWEQPALPEWLAYLELFPKFSSPWLKAHPVKSYNYMELNPHQRKWLALDFYPKKPFLIWV